MADRPMERVRNKTGEPRHLFYIGEEQWPVNRVVGDDEVLELPDDLALRLAEQDGWAFEGNEQTVRRRIARREKRAEDNGADDTSDEPAEQPADTTADSGE